MFGISGIPLNRLSEVSAKKLDGDLPDPLVNKGTLASRIASFFDSIGRALGQIEDDTRKLRQQEAIRGFAESLKDHDDPDIAGLARREVLTGRVVS